jgi:hypothetical protein
MAWTTALMSTSFPPKERVFSFQPARRFFTRSFIDLKVSFLFAPIVAGSPR